MGNPTNEKTLLPGLAALGRPRGRSRRATEGQAKRWLIVWAAIVASANACRYIVAA
jgi:hypothetical protein